MEDFKKEGTYPTTPDYTKEELEQEAIAYEIACYVEERDKAIIYALEHDFDISELTKVQEAHGFHEYAQDLKESARMVQILVICQCALTIKDMQEKYTDMARACLIVYEEMKKFNGLGDEL